MNHNTIVNKTRKKHLCFGCLEIIPAGSKANKYAGMVEGQFSSFHMCIPCYQFSVDHSDYCYDDGVMYEGDVTQGMKCFAEDEKRKVTT